MGSGGPALPSRAPTAMSTASSFPRGIFSRGTTGSGGEGSSVITSLTQRWTKMSPSAEAAKKMLPPPEGPKAEVIANALKTAASTEGAKIMVVGYSPTGGGHTARTLNIVQHAINSGELGEGSTVVFSVPEKWGTRPRVPPQMINLAEGMRQRGINVLVVGADKSVKGFLKASGASDDAEIIRNIADQPRRRPVALGHIQEAEVYDGNNEVFETEHTISGRDLFESMTSVIGKDAAKDKVFVLTDMDPDLQKGAMQAGIPGEHRVDQQNHAILLDQSGLDANLSPVNSILTKVLGGTGEIVSNIGLGDKTNPIADAMKTADALGITGEESKAQARDTVVHALLQRGRRAAPSEVLRSHTGSGAVKAEEGILFHKDVQGPEDIRNVIYVYAHGFQTAVGNHIQEQLNREGAGIQTGVASHIQERLEADDASEAYKNTMFVLCGPKAVTGMNAMHMGYVCDADAITTCGAGTNGEYAYLGKQAGAEASLMALPIKGHNEQETNADFLAADDVIGPRVTVVKDYGDSRKSALDDFVKGCYHKAAQKYADGKDMESILQGIANPNTYVTQAHNLLFGKAKPDPQTERIMEIEQGMRNNAELKVARKGVKVMTQVMTQAKHALTMANHTGRIELRLTQKGKLHEFKNLEDLYNKVFASESTFRHFVQNDEVDNPLHRLGSVTKRRLSSKGKEPEPAGQFPLFREVQSLMKEAAASRAGGGRLDKFLAPLALERRGGRAAEKQPEEHASLAERLDQLREEMGEVIKTGF